MGVSVPVAAKANGLSNVVDTIASPAEAFERQHIAPTWGWALITAVILLLIGTYLQGPAARHVAVATVQKMVTTSTLFANATPEKKQEVIANAGKPSAFTYIMPVVILFIAVFFNTIFMVLGNAVGRGQADFKRLWCGSMNIAVPTLGLGAVVLGAITTMRGAGAFDSSVALAKAMPSLAMLAPHAGAALGAFLAGISIFTVWGFFLNATMLRVTAKVSPAVGYTFAGVVLVLGALVAAGGAAAFRGFGG